MSDLAGPLARKISDEKYAENPEWERTSKVYVRDQVPSGEPLEILDIGCGTGLNARHLAEKGHNVTGIDISLVAIEKFRDSGFTGVPCDITSGLPFRQNSFDLVFASEVIEHIADTEAFIAETFRVLKPGGRILLSTPNSAFWVYRLFSLFGKTLSEIQHKGHIRFFSKGGLVKQLAAGGFEDIVVSGREIYLLVGDAIAQPVSVFFQSFGFVREYRFRTSTYFWHLSRFARSANPFWTDTLIINAGKRAP